MLWVDAHADVNTPASSPSGNMHGMPIGLLLRLCDPKRVNGFAWLDEVAPSDDVSHQDLVFLIARVMVTNAWLDEGEAPADFERGSWTCSPFPGAPPLRPERLACVGSDRSEAIQSKWTESNQIESNRIERKRVESS